MGLRYINSYDFSDDKSKKEIELYDFSNYFNEKMLSFSFLDDVKNSYNIRRFLNIIEISKNNYNLRTQYGLYNPDYPADMKRKAFILDFDCFQQEIIEPDTIVNKIIESHQIIQEIFELSIKDPMREVMNKDD